MPWNETDAMDQRAKFVMAYLSDRFEMAERCRLYGISRPTGYEWIARHQGDGYDSTSKARKVHRGFKGA